MATFNGTAGDNSFAGTAANDIFNYGTVTFSGATITAARGFDTISSGGGFDTLNFSMSGDHVYGDRVGNDVVLYIQPTTSWDENNPNTTLGGVRIVNFYSADGNGVIDRINFSDGYLLVAYDNGIERVQYFNAGGTLLDTEVLGSVASDALVGTAGVDFLIGNGGNDTLKGLAGGDELAGEDGNDVMDGGAGNDLVDGGRGTDTVGYSGANGSVHVDLALGTGGNATRPSGNATNAGRDSLASVENAVGGAYADVLVGGSGANALNGGAGNDTISGGAGNDAITGGAGNDSLAGGTGLDAFVFNAALSATTNVDRLAGFAAADDTIRLENAIFTKLPTTGTLAATAFVRGAAAKDAGDRIVYNSATGQIWYDSDGTGAAAKILFATVTAGTAITNADFVIF